MNDNEIEELEIGLEVDNSELKDSINEAKNIIQQGMRQIENTIKNTNIGDSLADSISNNLKKALDNVTKSLSKSNELNIKANVQAELDKSKLKNQSIDIAANTVSSTASALGGTATLAGAQKMSVAGKDLKSGGASIEGGAKTLKTSTGELKDGTKGLKEGTKTFSEGSDKLVKGSGVLKESTDKLTNGTGELTKGAGELKKGAHELSDVIKQLKDISEKLGITSSVNALTKYISYAKNYVAEIDKFANSLKKLEAERKELLSRDPVNTEAININTNKLLEAQQELSILSQTSENIYANFKKLSDIEAFSFLDETEINKSMNRLQNRISDVNKYFNNELGAADIFTRESKELTSIDTQKNQQSEMLNTVIDQFVRVISDLQKTINSLNKTLEKLQSLNSVIEPIKDGVKIYTDEAKQELRELKEKFKDVKRVIEEPIEIETEEEPTVDEYGFQSHINPEIDDDIFEDYQDSILSQKEEVLEELEKPIDANIPVNISLEMENNEKVKNEILGLQNGETIKVEADTTELEEVSRMLDEIQEESNSPINIPFNASDLLNDVQQVENELESLHNTTEKPIQILADNNPALKVISDINGKAQLLLKNHPALKGLKETIGDIGDEYYKALGNLGNVDAPIAKMSKFRTVINDTVNKIKGKLGPTLNELKTKIKSASIST